MTVHPLIVSTLRSLEQRATVFSDEAPHLHVGGFDAGLRWIRLGAPRIED